MNGISTNNINKGLFALILLLTQTLLLVHTSIHHHQHNQHSSDDAPCELCLIADSPGHGLTLDISPCFFSTFSLPLENTVFVPRLFRFIPSSPLPRSPPLV